MSESEFTFEISNRDSASNISHLSSTVLRNWGHIKEIFTLRVAAAGAGATARTAQAPAAGAAPDAPVRDLVEAVLLVRLVLPDQLFWGQVDVRDVLDPLVGPDVVAERSGNSERTKLKFCFHLCKTVVLNR